MGPELERANPFFLVCSTNSGFWYYILDQLLKDVDFEWWIVNSAGSCRCQKFLQLQVSPVALGDSLWEDH